MKIDFKKLFEEGRIIKGYIEDIQKGGQSCGIPQRTIFVEIPELNYKIQIRHRSTLKGFDLCMTLTDLYLNEIKYKF